MNRFQEGNKKISIIVPVYRAKRFLGETVASVQRQTYQDWELLLIDDCSGDGSYELSLELAKNDVRIRPIQQPQNMGAAKARNRGIDEALGRFICFLDADDIWESVKLEKELSFMQNKQAGFVFTGYEFADEEAKGTGKIVHVPDTITYHEALKNTTIFTSTVMIDRAVIADETIYMPQIASEDTATWWQILKRYGKGYGLDENLVRYRRSANTLSSNKMVAIKRIWKLYRKQEGLSVLYSAYCMCFWALRAVLRRV